MLFFKNITIGIASLLLLSATALSAKTSKADTELLDKIKNLKISKAHNFNPTEIKKGGSLVFAKGYFKTPQGDRRASMFLSKDLKSAVYGRGFSTTTAKEYKSYSIDKIKEEAALVYGSGKDEYILVIDPLCPYCMKFDMSLPKYEKNIKLYVVFMPLRRLHPTAPKAIAKVMSAPTNELKYNELHKISSGNKDFNSIKEIPKDILDSMKKQEANAEELGARGTPTLYLGNGAQVDLGILEHRYGKKAKPKKVLQKK